MHHLFVIHLHWPRPMCVFWFPSLPDQACSPLRPPLLQSPLLLPHQGAPLSLPTPARWRMLRLQQQLSLERSAVHLRAPRHWCLCLARRLRGCSTTTSNVQSVKHNSQARLSWSPTSSRSELLPTQWVYVLCCGYLQLWNAGGRRLFWMIFLYFCFRHARNARLPWCCLTRVPCPPTRGSINTERLMSVLSVVASPGRPASRPTWRRPVCTLPGALDTGVETLPKTSIKTSHHNPYFYNNC